MLTCCNSAFKGFFIYTITNSPQFCRRLEYGVCPICAAEKFRDIKYYSNGLEKINIQTGNSAKRAYNRWRALINNSKQGSYINQGFFYGDFKKTKKFDYMGNPIYAQLKKNFNGQSEILNEVITIYGKCEQNNNLPSS